MSKSPALILRLSLVLVAMAFWVAWPSQAFAQGIGVVAGTYGSNCGQPRGNKTDPLAAACNGRENCTYTVDYTVIGDSAVGCAKDYVAEWVCREGGEVLHFVAKPEAGLGSKVILSCEGASPVRAHGFGIRVGSATYGGNCNAPHGNQTQNLASACNGRADCTYKIDHAVIGDPAFGCGKDYMAEWRCGDGNELFRTSSAPEAGLGSSITLRCAQSRSAQEDLGSQEGQEGGIRVLSATYGGNCKAPLGNQTRILAAACNGRADCAYKIDYTVIGDPAVDCGKNYVAEWRCGRNSEVHRVAANPEAGFGSMINLGCPR